MGFVPFYDFLRRLFPENEQVSPVLLFFFSDGIIGPVILKGHLN
jgi:hypothetical protein